MRIEVAEQMPYGFPFAAVLRGEVNDYRRIDTPVIVQGFAGMETSYLRVQLPDGSMRVANNSMLYIEE